MTLKTSREPLSTDLYIIANKKQKTDNNQDSKDIFQEFAEYLSAPKMLPLEYTIPSAETDFMDELENTILNLEKLNIKHPIKKKQPIKTRENNLVKKRLDASLHCDQDLFDELYKKTEPPPKKVEIKPLTDEEDEIVNRTLRKGQHGIVSQYKNATVEFKDIYKLYPETWLNDEIINFYMALLSDRAESDESLPKIHCFNTFFCSTLREQGYNKVRRWTKRVDIFSKDLLLIPINRSYHWVLGAIDMKAKCVRVYDSLGGNHDATLYLFLEYLEQEHKDKKKADIDLSDWTTESPKGIPQQENMSDCGVFTCTFAERLARQSVFDFSQQDMVLLRRRMVLNILNKKL